MAIERQPRQRRLLVSNENHSHTKHHGPGRDKKLIWDHRIGGVHYEQGITCCRYFFILVAQNMGKKKTIQNCVRLIAPPCGVGMERWDPANYN